MNHFLNSQDLRSAGRSIDVPFQVRINCNGRLSELVCTLVLRVLPGKRLVCLGDWNARQVVVKFFLDPGSANRHCTREERGIKAFTKAGIKTPEWLIKGTLAPDTTPVLGFQRIIHAQNLAETWRKISDNQRVTLLGQVVAVIAEQHDSGIKQEDLHPGNFLITDSDIYTIDGDAVDSYLLGKPLSQAKSLKNLALFFAQFQPQFDKLVPEAFQKYATKRKWKELDGLFTRLTKEIHKNRNDRKKEYLKKIFRECTAFICRKSWHRVMICDRSFYSEEVALFLEDPNPIVDSGRLLKDGNSATVSLVEIGGQKFAVKRYNIKSFFHGLKRCIRPSRAWVSWRNAHRLSFILGIPTPKPIILIENRWGPFRSTAYFITEYIEGVDIYNLLHSDDEKDVNPENITMQIGALLQRLADASISHGDFKATNFILSNRKIFIVDLDAMREHKFRWRFSRAFKRDFKRLRENWTDLPIVDKLFHEKIKIKY